jgi:hypothetical protein
MDISLTCVSCTEKLSGQKYEPPCDQIGWYVPACGRWKQENNTTFINLNATYGYSSIPKDLCDWWGELPL